MSLSTSIVLLVMASLLFLASVGVLRITISPFEHRALLRPKRVWAKLARRREMSSRRASKSSSQLLKESIDSIVRTSPAAEMADNYAGWETEPNSETLV